MTVLRKSNSPRSLIWDVLFDSASVHLLAYKSELTALPPYTQRLRNDGDTVDAMGILNQTGGQMLSVLTESHPFQRQHFTAKSGNMLSIRQLCPLQWPPLLPPPSLCVHALLCMKESEKNFCCLSSGTLHLVCWGFCLFARLLLFFFFFFFFFFNSVSHWPRWG